METMLRSIKCDCHCDQESNMVMVIVMVIVMVMVMVHIKIVGRWKRGIPPSRTLGWGGNSLPRGGNPPPLGTLRWGGNPPLGGFPYSLGKKFTEKT